MFVYDFENQAVVGSKSAIARANKGINPEYSVLTSMLKAQPTFSVKAKIIDVKKDKKSYNGLTLDKMAEYIKTKPNSEKALEKFEAVKKIAKAKGACYPITKKWFLATYPEYKETVVSVDEEAEAKAEVEAEAEAELEALGLVG